MQPAALQIHTADGKQRQPALAALSPLALFAALSLAVASVLDLPLYVPALLAGALLSALIALMPARWSRMILLASLALTLGAMALSSVRDGSAALANRLYDASEAVNAYAYDYFEVADGTSPRAALPWLAIFGGALCAFASRRKIGALALFLAVAFAEAYFGATPPMWQNLLLFALLAPLLVRGRPVMQNSAALLSGSAAVLLLVLLLAPRPNAAVEAYSEHLRDELGALVSSLTEPLPRQAAETNRTHQESRQHEELVDEDALQAQGRQEFERRTETEREIALPNRVDYGRTALLLFAAIALLVVPFVPFVLLNHARRRAAERRAAFEDADNAAAIRAMFAHTIDWLRAFGLQTNNRPFAQCGEAVKALTSDEYAARYAVAAAIWQEAAYSEHVMSVEHREAVRALMETTEESLYQTASAKTRFRLKYVECLCEV